VYRLVPTPGATEIENSMVHSDLIFVLAGEQSRKEYGAKLFSEGFAPRLLLSVARFDVRRFSGLALPVHLDLPEMAAKLSPSDRHFFVLLEKKRTSVQTIARARFGTLREILALRMWLSEHPEIESLLVISSGFHLKRVRMCCRSLLPGHLRVDFRGTTSGAKWWKDARLRSQILAELLKVPFYSVMLLMTRLALIKSRSHP
jgi:hypothetical protein